MNRTLVAFKAGVASVSVCSCEQFLYKSKQSGKSNKKKLKLYLDSAKLCRKGSLSPKSSFCMTFILGQSQRVVDVCRRTGSGRGSTSQQVQMISMKPALQK